MYNTGSDDTLLADDNTDVGQSEDPNGNVSLFKPVYPPSFNGNRAPIFRKGRVKQATLEPHAKKFPTQGQK